MRTEAREQKMDWEEHYKALAQQMLEFSLSTTGPFHGSSRRNSWETSNPRDSPMVDMATTSCATPSRASPPGDGISSGSVSPMVEARATEHRIRTAVDKVANRMMQLHHCHQASKATEEELMAMLQQMDDRLRAAEESSRGDSSAGDGDDLDAVASSDGTGSPRRPLRHTPSPPWSPSDGVPSLAINEESDDGPERTPRHSRQILAATSSSLLSASPNPYPPRLR
eukprot:NODE_1354_length_905_cov_81.181075_g1119_i0.p1 GENE.NODE_1354_length_905_cov_81.181075_g1119_i0~~NODE_1354_length_905_cov_81.181075_g1119_i0.p1  ORF type:complete len:225 (-),score=51.82 NODE_1354_length_905_cov_81.181075_g1119_i0:180-854(-)